MLDLLGLWISPKIVFISLSEFPKYPAPVQWVKFHDRVTKVRLCVDHVMEKDVSFVIIVMGMVGSLVLLF